MKHIASSAFCIVVTAVAPLSCATSKGQSLDSAFANPPMLSSHDGRLDVDLVAAPGSCTTDGHPIKMDEVLLGPGRRGDRFRRVRKADTPLLARCTAPRSSASWAGRLEGHSRGTNEKGLNYASAR